MEKNCFTLMPFAEKYMEVYEQVYRPVCEKNGLRCWRVDEISRLSRNLLQAINCR